MLLCSQASSLAHEWFVPHKQGRVTNVPSENVVWWKIGSYSMFQSKKSKSLKIIEGIGTPSWEYTRHGPSIPIKYAECFMKMHYFIAPLQYTPLSQVVHTLQGSEPLCTWTPLELHNATGSVIQYECLLLLWCRRKKFDRRVKRMKSRESNKPTQSS